MQSLTAVVLGATGLIGQQLVQQLLADSAFSKVRILVRRPVELSHPKLEVEVVNFQDPDQYRSRLGRGDCIFCCIGTTNSKVKGDKAEYKKIDIDIPVNAARFGREAGFTNYLLVSAVGANTASANFYLSLKGEVEKEIAGCYFESFHVFRSSMLLGDRKEFRLGETIAKAVMSIVSVLLVGPFVKYKGIKAVVVAKAMIAVAKSNTKGFYIYHYWDMMKAGYPAK
ncbi:MAG: NAD(P)H-binding protein [Bacteroidota bacterium]|nr:NAD(P)H-binding protein [Bacteroidota bacterium]